ncbi:nucleoside diphosphate kinase homolog 5 isoform 1-T5 [Alca torda]
MRPSVIRPQAAALPPLRGIPRAVASPRQRTAAPRPPSCPPSPAEQAAEGRGGHLVAAPPGEPAPPSPSNGGGAGRCVAWRCRRGRPSGTGRARGAAELAVWLWVPQVQKEHVNSNSEAKMQMLMPEPQIFVERTLALIKPDVVDKEEEIEDCILQSGFRILQKRKLQLSPEQCSNFYADQYGKVFFPNLTAYMSSGPLVAMVLARHCAVSYWKELLGPSNSLRAKRTHPHSLRAIYGTDDLRNALHGSLSISTAEREIQFMFPEGIPKGI